MQNQVIEYLNLYKRVNKPMEGVFEVRGSDRQWRETFVELICKSYPNRILWTEERMQNLNLKRVLGSDLLWAVEGDNTLMQLINELYEGAWAVFMGFSNLDSLRLSKENFLPVDIKSSAELSHSVNAEIAIFSWYDDNEWLIVTSQ